MVILLFRTTHCKLSLEFQTPFKMIPLYCIMLVVFTAFFKAENTEAYSSVGEPKVFEEKALTKEQLYGEDDPYVTVLICEGAEFRSAISNQKKLWVDGVVPFEISDDYKNEDRKFILDAMKEFHNQTCIRFKPKEDEKSFIMIKPGKGCKSDVGQSPNVTKVILSKDCFKKGIVLHELLHALGFIHEQNRPDRDEFVKIDYDNVEEGSKANFNKFSENEVLTFNQTYDYGSVMHYGAFDFAKNKSKPTIIPRKDGVKIGQREGFSEKDLIKINLLYNCNETNNVSGDEMEPTTRTSLDLESREDEKTKEEKYGWISPDYKR